MRQSGAALMMTPSLRFGLPERGDARRARRGGAEFGRRRLLARRVRRAPWPPGSGAGIRGGGGEAVRSSYWSFGVHEVSQTHGRGSGR